MNRFESLILWAVPALFIIAIIVMFVVIANEVFL